MASGRRNKKLRKRRQAASQFTLPLRPAASEPATQPQELVLPVRAKARPTAPPAQIMPAHVMTGRVTDDEFSDNESQLGNASDASDYDTVFSTLGGGFQKLVDYNGTEYSGNDANKAFQLLQFQSKWGSSVSATIDEEIAPKKDGKVKPEIRWKLTLLSSLTRLASELEGGPTLMNKLLRDKMRARRERDPKSLQQIRSCEVDQVRRELAEIVEEEEPSDLANESDDGEEEE